MAFTPSEIFDRAADEGKRRLEQSMLELVSTSFIAGFTIVFGIVALGILEGLAEPLLADAAKIVGAFGLGIGVVFLIVGRAELFNENFFDPVAALFEGKQRRGGTKLLRLLSITFLLNLAGGSLFSLFFVFPGVLPEHGSRALSRVAEEIAAQGSWAAFSSAVIGGALVALLSFMLKGVQSGTSRILLAFAVGFLLAVAPFAHVIVTVLHVFIGILLGAAVGVEGLFEILLIAIVGNLVGGMGLVTLSHVAQVKGAKESQDGSREGTIA